MIYISDYGYAGDFNICVDELNSYDISACPNYNWIFNMPKTEDTTILTMDSAYDNGASIYLVDAFDGFIGYYNIYADTVGGVKPVLYLNAEESIKSGAGTSANPYVLR